MCFKTNKHLKRQQQITEIINLGFILLAEIGHLFLLLVIIMTHLLELLNCM